jgi:hypothetical protein
MRVPRRTRLLFGLVFFGILLSATAAQAATSTWTGGGGDDNWATAANWGGIAPSPGDDLVFPGGTPRLSPNNNFGASTSFNTISFTGSSGGYTLLGNAIQLVAGVSATNTAGTNTIQLGLTLTASQTFFCSIPGPLDRLRVSGGVDLGAFTLTFDVFSGSIIEQNGVISGTGGVTSPGGGVVFINSACTYTGPTSISNGDFVLGGSSLSPASLVTVNPGVLQFANGGSAGPVTALGGIVGCEGGGSSQIGNVTDLTLQVGSNLFMAMYSASNYGQLNASGNVSLGGALTLGFSFTSSTGDTFTIINNTGGGAVAGTFVGLPEGTTFVQNGRNYQITYVGGTGNDVVVTDLGPSGGPTATPTPILTITPTTTSTPPVATPTPTPGPGSPAVVPTLSTNLLVIFGLALALAALYAIRRSG